MKNELLATAGSLEKICKLIQQYFFMAQPAELRKICEGLWEVKRNDNCIIGGVIVRQKGKRFRFEKQEEPEGGIL